MRIGVVSDSHGSVAHTRPAIRMLQSLEVEAVLHCGDIGTPEVIEMFTEWPTHFVFGNCDPNHEELQSAIQSAGQTCHELFGKIELAGVPIALLHSHEATRFEETIASGCYRLVCYGHTHIARVERVGETVVLNPGALYRADPHKIAIVDLPEIDISHVEL